MKEKLEKKLAYYNSQFEVSLNRFLVSNTRKDRDSVIKYKTRKEEITECLKLLHEQED